MEMKSADLKRGRSPAGRAPLGEGPGPPGPARGPAPADATPRSGRAPATPILRLTPGGHVELLATQVWVLLRAPGVLAAGKALRSCLFAREFGGAGVGSVPGVGLAPPRPGPRLGAGLERGDPGPAVAGAEVPGKSRRAPGKPGQPAPQPPGAGSGAEGRVRRSGAPGPRRRPREQRWSHPITLKMKGWGCLALLLGALLGTAWARRSQDLHCGACRALVDELEWEIAQVDPKKTIQMGSFRINPDGSQSVVEVPYARSEAHLTELLEEVCDRMKEYGEQIDPSTHRKNYVRVVGRNGESSELDLQGIRIDSDISGTLKFACESIVEEYEDELIEFFSREADNVKDKLCSKRTDLCDHALHISHDEL